ncbi:MAG: hypothetical protein LIO77_01325 [Rikenellaceae bacterium]|nr:hypothetical protein [Rikenellaceae bacterium]
MKKLIFISFSIAVIATLSSCEDRYTGTVFSLGFIGEYYEPEEMVLESSYRRVQVRVHGAVSTYNGKKNPNERYLELAEINGDTKYKNQLLPGSNPALSENPTGVTVICDRDIDATHPAGAPLDDMIIMLGWTYSEYIKSGYKTYTKEIPETYGYDLNLTGHPGHSPFFKYLKDIKKEDLSILEPLFYLYPKDWPSGEYNLTVTMHFDGLELSGDVVYKVR